MRKTPFAGDAVLSLICEIERLKLDATAEDLAGKVGTSALEYERA